MKVLDRLQIRKIIAVAGVALLVISLVPILWMSLYNHPTGDDIYYGLNAHVAWEETGSVIETLVAAIKGVASDYYRWQGTFVALLIMRLQPTVFNEGLYFVTPFIVIGLIIGGLLYAIRKCARYILPMDKWDILTIWTILSFLMIQWVHAVGDAFYWFNGAVYYGGFFGIMLFGVGVCIEWGGSGKIRYIPILLLLAVMLGGGNYITLLISLILLTICWLFFAYKKNKRWRILFVADSVMLMCFVISAMAPGNAVRQANCASLPAIKAISFSLLQGFSYIDAWASGWWFLGVVVLLPTMLHVIVRSKFSFSYPGMAVCFLYGIFCAMQCPTMYAEASTGPGRVINVIWYGFVLFSYLTIFYVLGWIYRKVNVDVLVKRKAVLEIWVYATVVLLIVQCGIGFKNDSIKNMTTMKAISDLASGSAHAYDLEYRERLEILKKSDDADIVFVEYAHKPQTVYVGDYSPDVTQGGNQHLAKWYKKNSVCVKYGE